MTPAFGVDFAVWLAFLLLVGGVLGSVVPALPGALLSLSGVLVYWWATGYTDPGLLVLAALVGLALLVLVVDLFAGVLAARAGGASGRTSLVAGVVGLLLFFVAGPVGVLLGIAGTVYALERVQGRSQRSSLRRAAYTTLGVLASVVVQALLTLGILVAMVLVHVL